MMSRHILFSVHVIESTDEEWPPFLQNLIFYS